MSGIDWRARLPLKPEQFVDGFVVEGANHEELFDAIVQQENLICAVQISILRQAALEA